MIRFENKVRILRKGKQYIEDLGNMEIVVGTDIKILRDKEEYTNYIEQLIKKNILASSNWWMESNFLYISKAS